jgi:hypothetical protein
MVVADVLAGGVVHGPADEEGVIWEEVLPPHVGGLPFYIDRWKTLTVLGADGDALIVGVYGFFRRMPASGIALRSAPILRLAKDA